MPSITIQFASVSDGVLSVTYARNGDAGGHGWSGRVADLARHELDLDDVALFRVLLTWARRRGLTPAQMVGRTVSIDLSMLRNLITVE